MSGERYNLNAAAPPANGSRRWRTLRNHIEWQKEGTRRPVAFRPGGDA